MKQHRQAMIVKLKAAVVPPPPPSPPPAMSAGDGVETVVTTGSRIASNDLSSASPVTAIGNSSITNNQEADVDEGDIVKLHGETLVILRRGRLFTVSLAGGGMRPVDSINAYPPGVDARADWYDEMLVSDNRVVVIGYSYGRGGTEINRFHIDGDGKLSFEDAYQLRSNDYYSSRNYASRLVGHKLVFYTPRYIPYDVASAADVLPGLRRWSGDPKAGFTRIGTARQVYVSPGIPTDKVEAVHSITSCDLLARVLACDSTSVFGPAGRTFYVSSRAVYVWVTPYWERLPDGQPASMLYRLPLDGSAPSAIGVRGAPVDQFSFREDAGDRKLNVLVRAGYGGDAMWTPERSNGAVALLRLSLGAFGDGTEEAPRRSYHALPTPESNSEFHNRFVGRYVLYGTGNGWGMPRGSQSVLVAAPVAGGPAVSLTLPHGVDRIEVMGRDAVVVGSDAKNVYFSAIDLTRQPALGDRYVLADASQGETRSHAFFFSALPGPDGSYDGSYGVLGLPVARAARPGYAHLFETSAAMLFLRRTDAKFSPLGEIAAHDEGAVDDHCAASCTDWYGNARPIFAGNRTFALMGYELVEGELAQKAITEKGRVNFAPGAR